MIARAKDLSQGLANAEFHLATFPQHDLPLGRFDAIFSMEVLYYLPSLSAALEEVVRLLKPDGRFVSVVDFYQENSASHSWPEDVGVAMRLLSAAQWREAFEDAGLEVVEQARITLPVEQASESWKVDVGSLMTAGQLGGGGSEGREGSGGSR
jgi:SAM-dependent methyltransferase